MESPSIEPKLEDLILRGLDRDPSKRFETAHEMALALAECGPMASAMEVAGWLERVAGRTLRERAARVQTLGAQFAREYLAVIDNRCARA